MAFWSDPTLDPKRQFKFKVSFDYLNSANGNDSTFLAQKVDRPMYTIKSDTKVHYLDKEFNFPGKISWNQVKMTFVDAAGGDVNVAKRSYDYLRVSGWVTPPNAGPQVGAAQMQTISKARSVRATRDIRIDVLDSEGRALDQWVLKNAFVNTVNITGLDYSQDGILTAEYNVYYDWAEFSSPEYI